MTDLDALGPYRLRFEGDVSSACIDGATAEEDDLEALNMMLSTVISRTPVVDNVEQEPRTWMDVFTCGAAVFVHRGLLPSNTHLSRASVRFRS